MLELSSFFFLLEGLKSIMKSFRELIEIEGGTPLFISIQYTTDIICAIRAFQGDLKHM
jgi:hypothetical protein